MSLNPPPPIWTAEAPMLWTSPPPPARPSYLPTIITTIFLAVVGLWPAIRHSAMARERGYSGRGYWVAFGVCLVVPVAALVAVSGVLAGHSSTAAGARPIASSVVSSATASGVAAAPSPELTAPTGTCGYTKTSAPAARTVGLPPDPNPTPTANKTINLTTNLGTVTLALNGAAAPCNVQSIAFLASKGYYTGTSCHRLVTDGIYVLQCGDPVGDGTGQPGYAAKDENLSAADYSQPGTIAMANSGPNTNGSQFFIIYKDTATLSKDYTVIGKVTAGMDVIQKVAAAGSDDSNGPGDGKPKLALTFQQVGVS